MRNVNITVNIAGQNTWKMKQVDHTKFLGVYIDENCVTNFISIMFQWKYKK